LIVDFAYENVVSENIFQAKQATSSAMPHARAARNYRQKVIGRVGSGALDSDQSGLADPPEDWLATPPL